MYVGVLREKIVGRVGVSDDGYCGEALSYKLLWSTKGLPQRSVTCQVKGMAREWQ